MQVDGEEHAVDALLLWEVEAGVFELVLWMLVMEVLCVLCVLIVGVSGAVPGVEGPLWDLAEGGLCSHILLVL